MSVYLSSDGCFQKDNVPCQEVADYMLFCCCCFFLMNIDDLGVSVSHWAFTVFCACQQCQWTYMVKSQPYDTAVHSPNEITLNKIFITSVVPKKGRHFLKTALFLPFCWYLSILSICWDIFASDSYLVCSWAMGYSEQINIVKCNSVILTVELNWDTSF